MLGRRFAALALLASSAACTGGDPSDGGAGCGGAEGVIPAGLVEIAWDNGEPVESTRTAGFNPITVGETGSTFSIDEEPLWESVRFELDRPARIHAVSVAFANFDDGGANGPLEIGLFPDFGYNGIDYWRDNPYWTGDRCGGDATPFVPLDYVLDEPVEIAHPGLVFIGHFAQAPDDPTLAFDGDFITNNCAQWDDCHSAINMPDADASVFYQGVSLSLPYDYSVRLHVEWLDEVLPEERVFQPAGLPGPWRWSAWGDYDADGWEDLLLSDLLTSTQLWRNLGDGTFANVTTSGFATIGTTMFGAGGVWGDYDNDGCLDIYAFNPYVGDYPNVLLHSNCNGTFTDVTALAGPVDSAVTPIPSCPYNYPQSQSAAWLDIDSDSFLDLYVANYNCGSPGSYVFAHDVYRNRGDGTFEDWSETHGFIAERRQGRGTEPVDYDQDGDVDLLVHNYGLDRNFFYENLGNGTVSEIALDNGLAGEPTVFQGDTYFGHTLGAAWGDLDADGDFDLVEANLAHPRFFHFSDRTRVLLQDADTRVFFDIAGGDSETPVSFAGIRYSEAHTVPALGDFDRDGDLDLTISGRFEYTGRPTDFYWGNGDGTFALDTRTTLVTEDGWGMTTADYDHDGDLDLMTRQGLFRNDFATPGHWLAVRPTGNVRSNRAAIGATVRVYAGGRVIPGYVPGGSGQGCQDTQSVHFGLGAIDVIDGIEVQYAGGRNARYDGPFSADQHLRVFEDGTVLPGW